MKRNLEKDYPLVGKEMNEYWLDLFGQLKNKKGVERLFDFLETKMQKIDSYREVEILVSIYSDSHYHNFVEVYCQEFSYNDEFDAWEEAEILWSIRVKIEDYYKNNDDESTKKKLEDFLEALPEDLNQALV